ncbi:hypothetical protein [Massilia rhizosphaerae]|uniref:hypothetical protein n=1 Tax=Massilia rhizosphaerae TaxID=2784389 RepID=UPI0018DC3EB6|nr:hypothetical protein [Massilia rhizosphaerae]
MLDTPHSRFRALYDDVYRAGARNPVPGNPDVEAAHLALYSAASAPIAAGVQ